jgi:hypothetical protein
MVPAFTFEPFDKGGVQLCPCGIATATPSGIHRGLWTSDMEPVVEFPEPSGSGARCNPALICQVRAGGIHLRGFQTLISHVHLLVLLAGPVTI